MLMTAAMFRVLPPRWIPVALKIVDLCAWYGLGWFVYCVARRLPNVGRDRRFAATAAIFASLVGGSLYDANVGMENGLFAVAFWAWLNSACRSGWFSRSSARNEQLSMPRELATSLTLAMSSWIRPEGIVIFLVAHLYRATVLGQRRSRAVVAACSGLWVASSPVLFQFLWTGDIVATSVLSRELLGAGSGVRLGVVHADFRVAERLLLYFPLTFYFAVHVRRHWYDADDVQRVMWACLAVFFCLFTFVTGAPHVGRYLIFLMPIVVMGAIGATARDWQSGNSRRRRAVWAAAVLFLATNFGELVYRYKSYAHNLLVEAMLAPERRRETTERVLADLGSPAQRPVVLALEPIQIRYALDDRFVIRSIDGRTDRTLLTKSRGGLIDFARYVREANVRYIFWWPRAARIPWLAHLTQLEVGSSSDHDGLRIHRLSAEAFEVEPGSRESY